MNREALWEGPTSIQPILPHSHRKVKKGPEGNIFISPHSSLVYSSFISMSNERHCFILKTLLFLHSQFLLASVIFHTDLFHLKLAYASSSTTMKRCRACDLAWTSAVAVLAAVAGMAAQILIRLEISTCTSYLISQEFLAATCHHWMPLATASCEGLQGGFP